MADASPSPTSPAAASRNARAALLLPLFIALVGLVVMFAGPPVADTLRSALLGPVIDPVATGSIKVAPHGVARRGGRSWDSGYGVDD